jgi:hypothetical protein
MKACLNICLLFMLTVVKVAFAQDTTGQLVNKFALYNISEPVGTLFIHYDKTVFVNSEDVWFAAYLVRADSTVLKQQNTLSIVLSGVDKKIYSQHKYLVENGLANGAFAIPDSIAPGNYTITAYTNQLNKQGNPVFTFVQNITVKAAPSQSFTVAVTRNDTVNKIDNGTQFLVKINNSDINQPPVKKPHEYTVSYHLEGKPDRSGLAIAAGEYQIWLTGDEFKTNQALYIDVTYLKNTKHIKLPLSGYKEQHTAVRFYPEGGNLAAGVLNYVGWEAKNQHGKPVKATGILYENAKTLDTISTSNNGIGRVWLLAKAGSTYTFKLINPDESDKIYTLPAPMAKLPAIHIANAITNDTLKIQLRGANPMNLRLLVHNYHQIYADVPVLTANEVSNIKIDVSKLAKGIAAITILNEDNKPLAERLFFAHYNSKGKLNIITDKPAYQKREQITLDLDLTNVKTKLSDSGHVSIACVRDDRVELSKLQDIESYTYLSHELGDYQTNFTASDLNNRQALESILLIKGWRRYKWEDMMNSTTRDTAIAFKSAAITGAVTYFGKPLKKFALVRISQGEQETFLSTDKSGHFRLNAEDLMTRSDKPVNIAAYGGRYLKLTLLDQYTSVNTNVVASLPEQLPPDTLGVSTSNFTLKGLQNTRVLNAVVIKSRRIGSIDFPLREEKIGINKCGDYLCQYNCLNCPFPDHCRTTFIPIKGRLYQKHMIRNGIIFRNPYVVYYACTLEDKPENYLNIEGLRVGKEFYPIDSISLQSAQPLYQTTLYWNPSVIIDKSGKTKLSFYAGDIDGDYRVIVQGVAGNGLLFSDKKIKVEAK